MVSTRPLLGDMPFHHRFKTTRRHPQAHVDVDDDRANCDQRSNDVDEDDDWQPPMQAPRQYFWNPHDDPSQHQYDRGPEKYPVELLLPGIEAALRRHHLITILDVVLDLLGPLAIAFRVHHIATPEGVHPEDADEKDQADPRMPEADRGPAAEYYRQPIKMGSKEREPREHGIAIGQRIDPVADALFEGVA